MILLGVEVDDDLIEEEIPAAYLAKSPAFVEAKRLRLQLVERGCSFYVEVTGIDHCF